MKTLVGTPDPPEREPEGFVPVVMWNGTNTATGATETWTMWRPFTSYGHWST